MRSADHHMGRGLRWVLIATAVCAWSAPVLAGGPLYVVPAERNAETRALGRHGQGLYRPR